MPSRSDNHYSIPRLNRWFLVASLLLLASTAWMVIDDWSASWKGYQREARAIEAHRLRSEIAALEERGAGAANELALRRGRLESLEPSSASGKLASLFRDLPGVDFIAPRNVVKKQVLEDLDVELGFTKGTRIDMCQTCHTVVEREGFVPEALWADGELAQPHRSHPRLDLYLSASSPHPVNEVGCTICHRGAGQALDFVRADHRPGSEGQADGWRREHDWTKQPHHDRSMLAAEHLEASCVQCHQDSMERIAADAPRVTAGYRLYEQKGCYACHDLEWFPTERRPGPSLIELGTKLEPDWIASWIADPRRFRPTTDMPRVFHALEDPDEPFVERSQWGSGPAIGAEEWNETAVAATTAFLTRQAPGAELAPVPSAGDAERGREAFRVSGCLACHSLAPYPEEVRGDDAVVKPWDLAFESNAENRHGPNLRGVATKVNSAWLYHWLRDPQAYWGETRMPNLRLSERDAADLTAYLTEDPDSYFHEVPEGWQAAAPSHRTDVLREMARWFHGRLGRDELERRFAGENPDHRWDRDEELLVAVGEKHVANQGCYSCHEIAGFEQTAPIGPEHTTWGSRTVDRLFWASRSEALAEERGWDFHRREEHRQYRESWLDEKLASPRVFDADQQRTPTERMQMPDFDLSPDEILPLSTFLLGLVEDEVSGARMMPAAGEAAIDEERRLVRQQNCAACHAIQPGSVTFLDERGEATTALVELLPIGESVAPPAAEGLEALLADLAEYEVASGETVDALALRLLAPTPGIGLPGEAIFVDRGKLLALTPPAGGSFARLVSDYYINGIERFDPASPSGEETYLWNLGPEGEVEDVDGELRPYFDEPWDKVRWTFAPPVLHDVGAKLQREWFYAFLLDPPPVRQQMRVPMPTFNLTPAEAGRIVDGFAHEARLAWPARYAGALRTALGITTREGFAGEGLPYPEITTHVSELELVELERVAAEAELTRETLAAIEAGLAPSGSSGFALLKAYGDGRGFRMNGPIDPLHEHVRRRSPGHRAEDPELGAAGLRIATLGVDCLNCHWLAGQAPIQEEAPIVWAPDLDLTRERLREDWLEDLLWNPGIVFPGTAMPANFTSTPPEYQEQYPGSDNAEQVGAILDWLYNLDRAPAAPTRD